MRLTEIFSYCVYKPWALLSGTTNNWHNFSDTKILHFVLITDCSEITNKRQVIFINIIINFNHIGYNQVLIGVIKKRKKKEKKVSLVRTQKLDYKLSNLVKSQTARSTTTFALNFSPSLILRLMAFNIPNTEIFDLTKRFCTKRFLSAETDI